MRQIRIVAALGLLSGLAGCVGITGPTPAPSCDGGSRRPLNRSMWDWESARGVAPVSGASAASVPTPAPPVEPVRGGPASEAEPVIRKGERTPDPRAGTFASRPVPPALAASLQSCTGEVRHG